MPPTGQAGGHPARPARIRCVDLGDVEEAAKKTREVAAQALEAAEECRQMEGGE